MVGKANRTMVLSREPISVPSTMIVSIIRLCGVELWFGFFCVCGWLMGVSLFKTVCFSLIQADLLNPQGAKWTA